MNENQMLTKEEVFAVGYEWWVEAGELERGVNPKTENISKGVKRFFMFLAVPVILFQSIGVFFRSIRKYGTDAFGMIPIFYRFQTKYLEERGWVATD